MTSPLIDILGYLADTDEADDILNGAFEIPDSTCPYAAKLTAELWMPDSIRKDGPTSHFVSTYDHVQGWKKQKEGISADPDGLTFGHYKAGADDNYIAQFDASLWFLPYQHGFA